MEIILLLWLGFCVILLSLRNRKLRRLSEDLDRLLHEGTPLPISEYQEGELSILANQLQKVTLRLLESAEQSQRDKSQLADSLANISHQLRTPLTAMNLTTAMLSDQELPIGRRRELVAELKTLLRRTDDLVEALLKLSRLDAGTVTMATDCVLAADVIRRAAKPLEVPLELRGQRLVVSCKNEQFTGDLVWTAEAIGNLLKNAMEHTPAGGTISVTAWETALYTAITVEDTGPGFRPEEIPHLFERFYKGSSAAEGSCGIGLALARTIITAQNGTIQATNGTKGAKFEVRFYKSTI